MRMHDLTLGKLRAFKPISRTWFDIVLLHQTDLCRRTIDSRENFATPARANGSGCSSQNLSSRTDVAPATATEFDPVVHRDGFLEKQFVIVDNTV